MGWPGHTGQTSLAALSQTVKTKSIWGASGFANSSQHLLRRPSVGARESSICFSASGRTIPDGWLPALNAKKLGRPFRLRMASAMMERAEFPVHRKRTLYCFSIEKSLPDVRNDRALTAPQVSNNQGRSKIFRRLPSPGGYLRERQILPTHSRRGRGPTPYLVARSSIPFSSRRGGPVPSLATAGARPAHRRWTQLEFPNATNRRVLRLLLHSR